MEVSKKGDFTASTTQHFWHTDRNRLKQVAVELAYNALLKTRIRCVLWVLRSITNLTSTMLDFVDTPSIKFILPIDITKNNSNFEYEQASQ